MGKPVPVIITVYKDKKFDFIIKSPPASHFIKEAVKLKSGSKEPGRNIVASISKKQLEEIAKKKLIHKYLSLMSIRNEHMPHNIPTPEDLQRIVREQL